MSGLLLIKSGLIEGGESIDLHALRPKPRGTTWIHTWSEDEYEIRFKEGEPSPLVFSAKERGATRVARTSTLFFEGSAPIRYAILAET